jgi:hypothetical protein
MIRGLNRSQLSSLLEASVCSHRALHISVRLSGAYYDGHLLLDYSDVKTYSLEKPKTRAAHGDWLVDEIRLSENGVVLHEILFNSGSRWLIEAADISYEWHQIAV